jgi:glyoxylase-like metal-dependent hydrolase (beta-lactamase superfamily II)
VTLAVDRYELGPVGTNCYVVRVSRDAREAVVIDPGADAAQLRLDLARLGASIAAILITHCHYDHIGAVADLADARAVPVYVSVGEREILAQADSIYAAFGVHVRPYRGAATVDDGDDLVVAGLTFETVSVPGHSPGHVAYHVDGSLFSGDVLFAGGVGRVDLPGGDWEILLGSIRRLLDDFPPETVVYPGHGAPTTLGDELRLNPFLAELRV